MRTRDVRWSILLHSIINGYAAFLSVVLARYETYATFVDLFLLMIGFLWVIASIIIGIAASIYGAIEFFRKRKTLDSPAWIQILNDFNLRTEYLKLIIVFSIGFILIEGGIPVLFSFFYEYLGAPSRERLFLETLIEIGYWIPLIFFSLYFVYKRAKPLESPVWVSTIGITPSKPFIRRESSVPQDTQGETLFCTNCGKTKVPNSKFCVFCGDEYLNFGSEDFTNQQR